MIDLTQRVSYPRLTTPAPKGELLERVFKAGFRAPDHALLRPWRFIVLEGSALDDLGQIFVEAAKSEDEVTEEQEEKLRRMPKRAPMMIVGVVSYKEHPKVPRKEQLLSAGAAMAYMLVELQNNDFGGMWRTGVMAYHPVVKKQLGLSIHEDIVGFLYVGTPEGNAKKIPDIDISAFVEHK